MESLLFPNKPFSWLRHVFFTFVILTAVTLLALFVPKISYVLGLSGMIPVLQYYYSWIMSYSTPHHTEEFII